MKVLWTACASGLYVQVDCMYMWTPTNDTRIPKIVYEYFPTDGRDVGKDEWTNNNEDGTSL